MAESASAEDILEQLKRLQISLNFQGEYRYYLLVCGIFTPERNIIKNWARFEQCFLTLVEQDGKIGIKHLLQAIVQYFIRKYPEQAVYAATFMKLLYDQEIFDEDFIIKWHHRKLRLDKYCIMYDRKAEKLFKEQIASFVQWLE